MIHRKTFRERKCRSCGKNQAIPYMHVVTNYRTKRKMSVCSTCFYFKFDTLEKSTGFHPTK